MEITVQVINGTKPSHYVKKYNNTTVKDIVHKTRLYTLQETRLNVTEVESNGPEKVTQHVKTCNMLRHATC